MLVFGSDRHFFGLDVLDYQEKESPYRDERNLLHVGIELRDGERSSIIMANLLSTHELVDLCSWLGLVASGAELPPVIMLAPGLVFRARQEPGERFVVGVNMRELAAPIWGKGQYSHEPFDMAFSLTCDQLVESARQVAAMHCQFPPQ